MSMNIDSIYSRNAADSHYLWDAFCEALKSLKNRVINAWSKCTSSFAQNAEHSKAATSSELSRSKRIITTTTAPVMGGDSSDSSQGVVRSDRNRIDILTHFTNGSGQRILQDGVSDSAPVDERSRYDFNEVINHVNDQSRQPDTQDGELSIEQDEAQFNAKFEAFQASLYE